MHKCDRQAGNSGELPENSTSLGAKFRGSPRFRNIFTTDIKGIYMFCKPDIDIPRVAGIQHPEFWPENETVTGCGNSPKFYLGKNYAGDQPRPHIWDHSVDI